MGHDQLFKEFLHAFLRDFMELFYPEKARRLNFETVEFLNPQLFTDFPDGAIREVDVIARVKTQDGNPQVILIHIEVQARPESNFGARMLQYFTLLGLRFNLPVFPIVVYLRGGPAGLADEVHRVTLLEEEQLVFRYHGIGLAHLRTEEYLQEGNPVAAALGSLMSREHSEPATLRALMMLAVADSGLADAQKFLLVNMVESYFELNSDERARYDELVSRKEYRKVQDVEMTWADKMQYKGLLDGKRQTLLSQMEEKFGPLPAGTAARVRDLESEEKLDRYLKAILKANTLEELGL